MYCVYDENKKDIIAFHDDIDVVQCYVDSIYKHHSVSLKIGKIKRKKAEKYKDYEDLYLIRYGRYGDTYIQSGYLQYLEFVDDGLHEDHIFCRDILLRLLEIYDLPINEKNNIKKTVKIIQNILDHEDGYIPELGSLKDIKQDYDPYIYNSRLKRE